MENHTLTVREVAKMFEAAGVARTERSIVNWCQFNPMGVARLDCYFDPNERRYYITRESVERAIQEEKDKTSKRKEPEPGSAEAIRNASEPPGKSWESRDQRADLEELRKEVIDLKIANRGKDMFIEQLRKERVDFAEERNRYVERLIASNREVAQLESSLHHLSAPQDTGVRRLEVQPDIEDSQGFKSV